MALWAGDIAVVSLGMGCQGAHQIRAHARVVGKAAGAPPSLHRTPFDWIVCHPQGVTRMLGDWRFHPEDLTELVDDVTPYWPEQACWYWHDREHLEAGEFASRQAHYIETFQQSGEMKRPVFILSNTQRNLRHMSQSVSHKMRLLFRDDDIEALREALTARFPRAELWVAALEGRHRLRRSLRDPRVTEFKGVTTKWTGDDAQWNQLFSRILAGGG